MQADNPQQPPLQTPTPSTNLQNTKIDVVKVAEKIDIVSLVLDYGIDLIHQTNGEYICVCPFHADVNPSMRIYPETNTFYCYGCQAGASVFEFVMRMEDIDFKDALYKLAERAGYSSTFVLRDIELRQIDENFIVQRDKIEKSLHIIVRKLYRALKDASASKEQIFLYFDALWQWYDKQQYIFDKLIFKGHDLSDLSVKLYKFHKVFLQKLNELEIKITQVNNVR